MMVTQMAQISQILTCSVWDFADFADNLQNSFFFLGGFEEKAYLCCRSLNIEDFDHEEFE